MTSFLEYITEKKNEYKWFLKTLKAKKIDVEKELGLNVKQKYLNIDNIIHLKSFISFLKKKKLRIGEIVTPEKNEIKLKKISFVFLFPWYDNVLSKPTFVLFKCGRGPIEIAEVNNDDYTFFKKIIKI